MKEFSQKVLPLSLAFSVFLGACSGPGNFTKNMYSVSPDPLEMKGDSVQITITGNVPAKALRPKALVQFTPVLKNSDGKVIELKSVSIKGEKAQESADITINSKQGGKITYNEKIPYTSDLKKVKMYPKFTYKGVEVKVPDSIMVLGTITTASLIKYTNEVMLPKDDYKPELANKSVSIYFPMDVDKFNPAFKSGKQLSNKKQIEELKKLLKKDPNWIVKGISINAYASPDGELARNSSLSKGRSTSTFAFFRKELKKLGFSEVNDSNFSMGYMLAEDWKGFANELSVSNLADKDQMVAIINNTSISDDEREAQLRSQFQSSWKKAAETILPKLRRSELIVIGGKPFKTDADLLSYYGKYEQLTQSELYHLAVITSDLNKKAEVLNAYNATYSSDWRGFSDLGAVYILLNKYSDAETALNKAIEIAANNGVVLANLGALERAKGNFAKAAVYYAKAEANGANVSYNKGLLDIKSGNYASAVNNFTKSGKNDYNAALAKLLNGDANGAKTIIDNINPDELTWEHYYLRAICGARLNNQDVCTTNIAQAVAKNAQARNMAKEDLEFRNFFKNPLFEAAIR